MLCKIIRRLVDLVKKREEVKEIKGFFGPYRFLSNFHVADVMYEGLRYPSTEAAFQAAKSLDKEERLQIAILSQPKFAKRAGRRLALRSDWESVKDQVMYDVCLDKFTRHADLKKALLETGSAYLEETNTWGDRYWGVDGHGKNRLGQILMRIRDELKGSDES